MMGARLTLSAGIALSALFCFSAPVFSAEILGTSVIGGKRIEFLSDGTWRFKEFQEGPCVPITTNLTFCGNILDWKPKKPSSSDIVAEFRHDDKHYGLYIVEEIGTDNEITAEFMRSSVLENAAIAAGVNVSDIPVYDIYDSFVDDKPSETIVYGARIEGAPFVYANTIVVTAKITVQVLTFNIGKEYTPKHAELHEQFVKDTRLSIELDTQ